MNATASATAEMDLATEGVCAVCGREAGLTPFCHIYRDGRTITLCAPACAELFLHRSDSESLAPSPWASVHEYVHVD